MCVSERESERERERGGEVGGGGGMQGGRGGRESSDRMSLCEGVCLCVRVRDVSVCARARV